MKILSLLVTLLLLINASSQEELPELKEASALSESVSKLFYEKKFEEALPLAKRALEIRQRLLPRTHPQVVSAKDLGHGGDENNNWRKGNVIDVRDMCQGPPFITAAAIDAARGAQFEPVKVGGRRRWMEFSFTASSHSDRECEL